LQVNNTDAEGRLTLADALVYACNQGAEKVSFKHSIVTNQIETLYALE
jgi:leucyl aminopeptidase